MEPLSSNTKIHKNNDIDVSIIIVNFFTSSLLENCLTSILEKTVGITYELIVVDNSCSPPEKQKLTEIGKKQTIRLIFNDQNYGFGKANNMGSKAARGKYLFFLNSDTQIKNNAIQILFDFIQKNQKVGIVGGNLLNAEEKPTHSFVKEPYNNAYFKMRRHLPSLFARYVLKKRDYNYTAKPQQVYGYICGADLMINAALFRKIGGFDSHIFMYGEDALLCYHCLFDCHQEIWQIPSAKIIHFEGQSSANSLKAKTIIDGDYYFFLAAFGPEEAKKHLYEMKKTYRWKCLLGKIFRLQKLANDKNFFAAYQNKLNSLLIGSSEQTDDKIKK